jgi:hypothetical protein
MFKLRADDYCNIRHRNPLATAQIGVTWRSERLPLLLRLPPRRWRRRALRLDPIARTVRGEGACGRTCCPYRAPGNGVQGAHRTPWQQQRGLCGLLCGLCGPKQAKMSRLVPFGAARDPAFARAPRTCLSPLACGAGRLGASQPASPCRIGRWRRAPGSLRK